MIAPGLSASSTSFPWLVDALAQTHDIVIFDPRGVGQTTPRARPFRLQDVAEDAIAILDAEEIDRVHLLGISMGGMVAQYIALDHPDRLLSLALCCTTCGMPGGVRPSHHVIKQLVGGVLARSKVRSTTAVAERFGGILFAADTPLERRAAFFEPRVRGHRPTTGGLLAQLGAVLRHSTHARLPQISAPTTVFAGEEDTLVPPENGNVLAQRIPGAAQITLPGAHVFFYESLPPFLTHLQTHLDRAAQSVA